MGTMRTDELDERGQERVHECTACGHAYTGSYGSEVEVVGGTHWRCFACQDERRKAQQR